MAGLPTGWDYEERTRIFTLRYKVGGTEAGAVESGDAAAGYSRASSSSGEGSSRGAVSSSAGATLIFKHKQLHYPGGVAVSIMPSHAASWAEQGGNYLVITHNQTEMDCARADGRAIELEVVLRPLTS